MAIRISHRIATKTGDFECAFCHAKYNTPEERMECEQECLAEKQEAKAKKIELEKQAERERLQDLDSISKELELIRDQYKRVTEHVKQHNIKYNDSTVILDGTGEEFVLPIKEWNKWFRKQD